MRVADTSALYACFASDDRHHEQAVRALGEPEPILVPSELLAETLGLLSLRFGRSAAVAAGTYLRGLPHVEIQPTPDEPWDNIQETAWSTFGQEHKLSHRDCIVVAWCRRRHLKPFSFDKEILKALSA